MTDPVGRQITIGHGAFIELLDIAAGQAGFRLEIELYLEGEHDAASIAATSVVLQEYPEMTDLRRHFQEATTTPDA